MEENNNNKPVPFNNRLNHFILWAKNWYINPDKSKDTKENIFNNVRKALYLDGYHYCTNDSDVISIITNYVDEYIAWYNRNHQGKTISFLSQSVMWREITSYMRNYDYSYHQALLMYYRNFFAFNVTSNDIKLERPVYSKKLFKHGFIKERKIGMTYKEMNKEVKEIFG